MPVYVIGTATCCLCGEKLNHKEEDINWFISDDFIDDMSDPLWKYSDQFFHYTCYNNWDKKEEFETRLNKWKEDNPDTPDNNLTDEEKSDIVNDIIFGNKK